jgi:hypothetical protein
MSASPPALRIVAFADPEARVWGTALDAGAPAIVFGTRSGTGGAAGPDAIRLEARDGAWSLAGEGVELTIAPDDGDRPPVGGEELCQVRGTLVVDGEPVTVDCRGTRTEDAIAVSELDSLRGVWGWFEERHAVGLLALRPRGRGGHDNDRLEATLFDTEGAVDVDEPRLSTTYTARGRPLRASLELWVSEGEEQYPRRAAAEALGDGGTVSGDGIALQVSPMRCHSRGLDGTGVYLLARFRSA